MRILVLSDTHSDELPKAVLSEIKNVDRIFHVGDFTDIDILNRLKKEKEVFAVYGNMDGMDLRGILPKHLVVKCGDVRIGLFHGEGGPDQLLEKVCDVFKQEKLNAIVFGHSHKPMNEVMDGVLMFNPGSPTDIVRSPFLSYGILEINGSAIKGQIVKIKS